jgi:Tol biopolymer transport system component
MRGLVFIAGCCLPLAFAQASANSSSVSAGEKIVFSSIVNGGDVEVFVVNVDGSDRRALTTNIADDMLPAWSPDHARIAFARKARVGKPSIWVMSASGTDQHRLGPGTHPSWSPSGSQLAFERNGVIYTMTDHGKKVRRITKGTHPAWAQRGKRIAFERGTRVFLARLDTRAVRLLADRVSGLACEQYGEGDPAVATLSSPEWSPDASRIVVALGCDYYKSAYAAAKIVGLHGGVIGDIPINNLALGSRLAWSPDGMRLAFAVSTFPSWPARIDTAKLDGTEETTVTETSARDEDPDW